MDSFFEYLVILLVLMDIHSVIILINQVVIDYICIVIMPSLIRMMVNYHVQIIGELCRYSCSCTGV